LTFNLLRGIVLDDMERFSSTSHRVFSVRGIFTFVLVVMIATLLSVLIGSHDTHAADPIANWTGETIVYDGHGYTITNEFNDTTNSIPNDATIYKSPVLTEDNGDKKILVLYFASGLDPPTATTVKYVEFDYDDDKTSNASNKRDVTLTLKGEQDEYSSCSVEGIGWIVCPVSTFIAKGMDTIFDEVLAPMIAVQPAVLGDTGNSMYIAWNAMRNIANIAFVIVFLVIIYSQLTNFGISNYGLKKLIPRLIIAAILVNVSFIIAAIAIDLSNILGYSIQNIFISLRENLAGMTNDNTAGMTAHDFSWAEVTAIILAGGGTLAATGLYVSASGGLWLLIPLLLGLISVLILVVVVLAARQAIIVILLIIAPVAFVANLLPNTEKWFDKWKDLFVTMLLFFPAFSLVFGGSQLAGRLIIQNANDSIVTLLFGMAVQIAPLVITPLILKFSGSLLGRIAQITNNPSKGLLDRSKNWAKDRGEFTRQRNLAGQGKKYNPTSWGAGMVRSADFRKRRLQDRTSAFKQMGDNQYHGSAEYGKIHEVAHGADLDKQRIENKNNAHIQTKMNTRGSVLNVKTIELEGAKVSAERANAQTADMLSGYRAGSYNVGGNERLAGLQTAMAKNVIETAAWKQGEQNNQYQQQRNISTKMRSDEGLLKIAQGYGNDEQMLIGRERAQAGAVATLTKLNKDARDNSITLMQTEAVEAQMSVKDYAIRNYINNAKSDDAALRSKVSRTQLEAALEIAADDGQVTVFDDARASKYIDQNIVDAVVARNVGNMKSKGGFHIQADPNLSLQRYIETFNKGDTKYGDSLEKVEQTFAKDLNIARLGTLSNTTSANLGGMKFGAFTKLASDIMPDPGSGKNSILDLIPVDASGTPTSENDQQMVKKIYESLRLGLEDPSTRAAMTDRLTFARNMEETLRAKFFADKAPLQLDEHERALPGGGDLPASMQDNFPLATGDVSRTDSSPVDVEDE
jgi:hypothetical protein